MIVTINVRWNSCHPFPVELDSTGTVQQLKEIFSKQHGINPNNMRIIFQGKELQNHISIEDCGLQNFSVLHAVPGKRRLDHVTEGVTNNQPNTNEAAGLNVVSQLVDRPTSHEDPSPSDAAAGPGLEGRAQYFVYCKTSCADIRPGRLRVRCASCKQQTIEVDRGPNGWEDVLLPERVTGSCHTPDCGGKNAEFFFKCSGHRSLDEQESAVVLPLVKPNRVGVACLTCGDVTSPVLVFPCQESHAICLDCFQVYCMTRLNDRAFVYSASHGYTLGCPAGCPDSLITQPHHFRIVGQEQYERFQRFGVEECLLQEGGVLCPAPGCGEGVFPIDSRRVSCVRSGCRHVFCRDCLEPFHEGECSDRLSQLTDGAAANRVHVDPRQAERAKWDQASTATIRETTKTCPRCRVPVEKAGGCMHMVCSRCCFQWCWLCHTEWNRDCQGDHWFD